MHAFSHSLTRSKNALLAWKSSGLGALHLEIRDTDFKIQTLELEEMEGFHLDSGPFELRTLYTKFNALLRQDSVSWAQRAHMPWIKGGDENSNFFHNCAKICRHTNFILLIVDDQGSSFSDREHIEETFLNFYTHLWSEPSFATFSQILQSLSHELNSISSTSCDQLTREVAKEENFNTLIILLLVKVLFHMASMLNSINSFGRI